MYVFDRRQIFNSYQALIFDLDGTLIDSMPEHVNAWMKAAAVKGFTIDPAIVYSMGGTSSYVIACRLKEMGFNVGDPMAFFKLKTRLYRENLRKIKTFPYFEELLREAYQSGLKIAVGTGTQRINADDVLKNLSLDKLVAAVVTSDEVVNFKPHPETFLKCAEMLGLKPSSCLVLDDGKLGVEAAFSGGFDCLEVKNDKIIAAHFLVR